MARDRASGVLLLSCPDRGGLVAAVAGFLADNGGNILHADQHRDEELGLFLQRVEWSLAGFRIPRDRIADEFRAVAERFGMAWDLRFSDHVARTAVFVSKQPHCVHDVLARQHNGELRTDIPLMVSNHPTLAPLAESFGVEFFVHDDESSIFTKLEQHRIDLVVLARYMRVLGDAIVSAYAHRIINIHHSFLPAFAGRRPYHRAHERGVKIIGATAHYATPELDEGPIIEQDVVRVSHRDSVADLTRKGRDLERVVLARAIDLHLRHRVLVYGNKTVVFD